MLTIIIAIAIVFVFVLIIAWLTDSPFIHTIATGICFVVVLVGCTIGVVVPVNGFNEWKLTQETELVTLSNSLASGGVGMIYVSLSADNAYTYIGMRLIRNLVQKWAKLTKRRHLLEKM